MAILRIDGEGRLVRDNRLTQVLASVADRAIAPCCTEVVLRPCPLSGVRGFGDHGERRFAGCDGALQVVSPVATGQGAPRGGEVAVGHGPTERLRVPRVHGESCLVGGDAPAQKPS